MPMVGVAVVHISTLGTEELYHAVLGFIYLCFYGKIKR